MAGLSSLPGYREGPPLATGLEVGDPAFGFHAALAALAGLVQRAETGPGSRHVLSHLLASVRLLGPELVALQQGMPIERPGNRDQSFVPQGVFPCRGVNRWIAISVRDDGEWAALADVLRHP